VPNCPLCIVPLDRVKYEGFPVHKCPKCNGVLIDNGKIENIKREMQAGTEELLHEANAGAAADAARELKCPGCNCTMTKERAFERDLPQEMAGVQSFGVDVCGECNITWLDGGELAKVQLNYEHSPTGVESHPQHVKYDELSPAEKEAFVRAMADSVPDTASSYASAFGDAVSRAAQDLWRSGL